MKLALSIVQVVLALLVGVLILLQPKGVGMGRAFGSTAYHSRRGMETIVFRMTIFLASAFVVVSVINQLI